MNGLPQVHRAVHRYVDNVDLNASPGVPAQFVFRLNSAFDPQESIGGHQLMGFDQMAEYYSTYNVLGAKIRMEYVQEAASNQTPGYFGIIISDQVNPISSLSNIDILEQRQFGRFAIAGKYDVPAWKTKYWSQKKWFRNKNIPVTDLRALVSDNPVEPVYASVMAFGISGNDPGPYVFTVTIDMIIEWSEPKVLGGS